MNTINPSRHVRPSILAWLVMGALFAITSSLGYSSVYLTWTTFNASNRPSVYTNDDNVYNSSSYRLRVKINGVPGYPDGFHAVEGWNNNGQVLEFLPPPGTYQADVYWLIYSDEGDLIDQQDPHDTCMVTIQALPPPSAPTAYGATGVTSSGFTANWSASSGANGYRLDVSTNSSFVTFVSGYQDLNVGNTTSRSVGGLSPGTTYYYRVRAYNDVGTSSSSNTVAATTTSGPPPAPFATSASSTTSSGFIANWNSSSGATGYRIDVSTSSAFNSFVSGYQNLDVSNVTSRAVSGLSASTTYYYRVRAYSAGGTSGDSNIVSTTTSGSGPDIISGLVGRWAFEEGGGSTTADSAGGNTGYLVGPPAWVTGTVGNYGLFFDGSSQKIDLNNAGSALSVSSGGSLTISAWIRTNGNDSYGTIVSLRDSGETVADLAVGFDGGGNSPDHAMFLVRDSGGNLVRVVSANAVNDNTWHHLAAVFTSGSSVQLYIDGVSAGSVGTSVSGALNFSGFLSIGTEALWDWVGNYTDAATSHFNGTIDDVRVYHRALQPGDITALFATGSGGGVPQPPTAIAATGVTTSGFTANWNTATGATGYRLDVSTSSSFGSFVSGYQNLDVANVTSRAVSGLIAGTTYYYRVRAYNTAGTSTNSNTISASTTGGPNGDGLKGDYYNGKNFDTFALSRVDATVDFTWYNGAPGSGVGADNFSVRWTGQVMPRYSETYTFSTTSDDGVRLWVNNQLLIDNWTDHGDTVNNGSISLTANQKYDIRMEMYENGGGATARLAWSSSSQANQIIPQSQLFSSTGPTIPAAPVAVAATSVTSSGFTANWNASNGATGYRLDVSTSSAFSSFVSGYQNLDVSNVTSRAVSGLSAATTYYYRVRAYNTAGTSVDSNTVSAITTGGQNGDGLKADYYNGKNFDTFALSRVDATVDFGWGYGSPGSGVGVDNFSVRWTGQVMPRYSESYTFSTTSDDGVRLWVNNQLLIDNWTDHGDTVNNGSISLTANQKYDIRMEMYESGGGATARLAWSSSSQANQIIPQSQLFSATGPTIPPAPAAIAATGMTSGGFTANWNTSNGATGYRLDVSTSSLFVSFVSGYQNLDVSNATSWPVSGLSAATTYYYRVRAYNTAGTSVDSNIVSAITTGGPAGDGLKGDYYNGKNFDTFALSRVDATVDFGWGNNSPAAGVGADNFSVRWTGQVMPQFSETYTFSTTSDDGVRLWVNNQLLVDNWSDHPDTVNNGAITLTANQKYDIRLEMYENGGGATARLAWSSSSQANQIIPQGRLYSSGGGTGPTTPSAPIATSATNRSTGGFTANWNVSSGATGYRLDISPTNTFATFVPGYQNLDVANTTSRSVSNLSTGTTYYYRVRAYNTAGTSTDSNTITASTLGVPVVPVNVADVTLLPPNTDGRTVFGTAFGYEIWNEKDWPKHNAIEVPLFSPYTRGRPYVNGQIDSTQLNQAWWDNAVNEMLSARIGVIFAESRGCYDPSDNPPDFDGNGNDSPRHLYQLVDAINRAGAANVIKIAMFDESGAYPGAVTHVRDPGLPFDKDSDGIPDDQDPDKDGDGIPNAQDGDPDNKPVDLADHTIWEDFFWLRNIRPFFKTVPSTMWYRYKKPSDQSGSPGHPVIVLFTLGDHAFKNQQGNASQLLEYIRQRFQSEFSGEDPYFIVDGTGNGWLAKDTTVANVPNVIGANNWVEASLPNYTFRAYTSSTGDASVFGATNPGFHDDPAATGTNVRILPRNNGGTLTAVFDAAKARNPMPTWIMLEGWANIAETSGFYRSAKTAQIVYDNEDHSDWHFDPSGQSWAFPNQYIQLVREYADRKTATLRLEAEWCDTSSHAHTAAGTVTYRRAAPLGDGLLDVVPVTSSPWEFAVGHMGAGEWIEFQDVFFSEGTYRFAGRGSSDQSGNTMTLFIDGVALPDVGVPSNGTNYDAFGFGERFVLQGKHTLRVVFNQPGSYLDWIFLKKIDSEVTFKTSNNFFLTAKNDPALGLDATQSTAGTSQKFTIADLNGGQLQDGDVIRLQAANGYWVRTEGGGGSTIGANAFTPSAWELFTIQRVAGPGVIQNGDQVALLAGDGTHYVFANNGGGGTVGCDRTAIGPWETFVINF